ncbi:molybdenum cofactor guanylyltransferase [Bacillaceae bacterium W0354]
MTEIIGIIVGGGQSKRFGSPKAFAKLNDLPFYHYSLKALTPFCDKILIATSEELKDSFKQTEQIKVIIDDPQFKGQGPLVGILSAMRQYESSWYLVLPVDVPFIESEIIEQLLQHLTPDVQAIIPIVRGREQPLIAIYHHSVKEIIAEQLRQGEFALKTLMEKIEITFVHFEQEEPFRNINRKSDL